MKQRLNTLYFKIVFTVSIGILCLTVALSVLNISASKQAYIQSFMESQKKIFNQVDSEIYDFFKDVAAIHAGIGDSNAVIEYLTIEQWPSVLDEWNNILALYATLDSLPLENYNDLSLILLGINGKVMNDSATLMTVTSQELLRNTLVMRAVAEPKKMFCEYMDSGFTDGLDDCAVIVMAKAIRDKSSGAVIGVSLLSVKETDFCRKYDYFTGNTSDIIIFNEYGDVLSSNQKAYMNNEDAADAYRAMMSVMQSENVKEKQVVSGGHVSSYMIHRLQNTNYTMMGVIDPSAAFMDAYSYQYIISISVMITAAVALIIFVMIRKQTKPLSKLAGQMEHVRNGEFNHFAVVSGNREIQEVAAAYNTMLVEIDKYIKRLMQAEREKREAEIKALQMQINPHYIYNTLTSVKWLIWQGEKEKSVKVIESFITLLRNTISNKQDMITLKQEIENLKHYVFINQIRYGSKVQVEYYILPQCENYMVPKLILQPFVENAFFHAFPDDHHGTIAIFAKQTEKYMLVEIIDDGVGIEDQRLSDIKCGQVSEKENFTGIGVHNVDGRIKLIYGPDYGIDIESTPGKGTVVTVRLPVQK